MKQGLRPPCRRRNTQGTAAIRIRATQARDAALHRALQTTCMANNYYNYLREHVFDDRVGREFAVTIAIHRWLHFLSPCAVMRLVQVDSYVATKSVVASRPTTAPRRAENHFQHTLTEIIRPPSDIWSTVHLQRHGSGHAYGFWHRFKLPKSTHVDVQQDVFVGGRGSDRSTESFKRLRAMSVATCAWCGKVASKLRCKRHHPKWRRVSDLVRLGV